MPAPAADGPPGKRAQRREGTRASAAPRAAGGRRGLVVAALMLAMALTAMDSSIVATAVPQIVGDLGGFAYYSWMFSGYLLAVTVSLPVYGKLADSVGRRPVLLAGTALFIAGSLLCAGAWSMPVLIAFRLVQGFGGGAIQGTVQTLAGDLYPMEQRGRIQAAISTVWAVSAVSGPALGGVFAGYADWRWIFLINLPIGAGALWLLWRHLVEPRREPSAARRPLRIDWLGALGLLSSTGLLLFGLVQGGTAWAWGSPPSLLVFAGAVLLGAATVLVERRAAEPIIPGWVWRRRPILGANLFLCFFGLLMIAPTVFLPTYAQSVLGLAPIAAGFVLSVMTVSWPIASALANRIYLRVGFRNTSLIGMSFATLLLASFVLLPYRGPAWQPALLMFAIGAGLGLSQIPLIVGVQSSVPWGERGTATASVLFCRQVGQSIGAVLFAVVANTTIAGRLRDAPARVRGGLPSTLDGVSRALDGHRGTPAARDYLRHAVTASVDHVYLGAAACAVCSLLILFFVTPKRFPVVRD
ncbi:MDR family MFS transporter [Phaeacidiphilus oryzae]|uniref:MDR family MFS transporter n=1 Tax=Phaeacidiphilus oryzae TaxID=348818 RepID=UPI00068E1FAF